MSKEAPVSIARVLAAKEDLLLVEKTNSERVRRHTQSSVNKIVIGKVWRRIILVDNIIVENNYNSYVISLELLNRSTFLIKTHKCNNYYDLFILFKNV